MEFIAGLHIKKTSDLTLEGTRALIGGYKFGQIEGVKNYLQSVARYVRKENIKKNREK